MKKENKKPYEESFDKIVNYLKDKNEYQDLKRDIYFIKSNLKYLKKLEDFINDVNTKILSISLEHGANLISGLGGNYEEDEE